MQNSITDVPGLLVGHADDPEAITGCTVVLLPAGTPKAVVDRLNAEINKVIAKPEVKAAWDKQGAVAMSMTPAEFDAYLRKVKVTRPGAFAVSPDGRDTFYTKGTDCQHDGGYHT